MPKRLKEDRKGSKKTQFKLKASDTSKNKQEEIKTDESEVSKAGGRKK